MSKELQIADAATALSVTMFLGISFSGWNALIHMAAGMVAIVAGLFAIYAHIKRL